MKGLKGALLALIILAIMSGAVYMLMVMDVIPSPAFVENIPVLGERLASDQVKLSPEEQLKRDKAQMSEELVQRETEFKKLEATLAETRKLLNNAEKSNKELQTEIKSLTEQLEQLKTRQSSQQSAYQDMARYFTEMKAKDAADLLSRQKDQDIIGILQQMQASQAAEILQNMDREKAAAITRQMLAVSP